MSPVRIPEAALRGPYTNDLDHLYDELARIELLVRAQAARWRVSPAASGPEREWAMLVISNDEIDKYLEAPLSAPGTSVSASADAVAPWWDAAKAMRRGIDAVVEQTSKVQLRLSRLRSVFGLSGEDVDVLLLALLPELDERYARLFGYLQNDASDRALHVELATQILQPALPADPAQIREIFAPDAPLLANRLIALGGGETLRRRSVRIDDRIASYLLGSNVPDARLAGVFTRWASADAPFPIVRKSVEAMLAGLPDAIRSGFADDEGVRVLLTGPDAKIADAIARALCRQLRVPLVEFDIAAAAAAANWDEVVTIAFREARLQDSALLCRHAEALCASDDRTRWMQLEAAVAAFTGLVFVAFDSSLLSPSAVGNAPFWPVDIPAPDFETRERIWRTHLPAGSDGDKLAADLAQTYQMTASQVEDAVAAATHVARRDLSPVTPRLLFDAARRQAGTRLVSFARRIEPRPSLSIRDVVLPLPNQRQLLDLQNRITLNRELFQRSGLEDTMRIGKGVLALFAGGSGTGKTLAAEALAAEAQKMGRGGVDLHLVDLSAVVSKWVGETEKNLTRIFVDAERSNGWLFFDEGESLFGTRGDTTKGGSAQDRLMNLEVSVLLQCVESFSGVVILATNLRQNIDPAFLRRIHAVVEFPQPAPDSRAAIWRKMIPSGQRCDFTDDDVTALAFRFEISGGNIRNVVLDALFRAYAAKDRILTLRHIGAGLAREYQKLGRPITLAEFGDPLYAWIVKDILDPPAAAAGPEQ